MKRKVSFYLGLKAFNITLHNVDLILNNRYLYHLDKMDTGKKITLDISKFKNENGNSLHAYRRPKTIELRSKEGIVKIGVGTLVMD